MHPPYPLARGGKKTQTPPTFPPLRRGGVGGAEPTAHAMHLKPPKTQVIGGTKEEPNRR